MMHYYPALTDERLMAMPWRRRDALAREMVIAHREQAAAEKREMRRVRAQMARERSGTTDPYGDESDYSMPAGLYGSDPDAAMAIAASRRRSGSSGGGSSGGGRAGAVEQALARDMPRPTAWTWND